MKNSVAILEKGKLYDVVNYFVSEWDNIYYAYRLAPGNNRKDFFLGKTDFEIYFYSPEETINILRIKTIEKMLNDE